MNVKQIAKRRSKAQEKVAMLRKEMWPEVSDTDLWHRLRNDGYTTIPRTMPILMNIIDDLSKGKPCGQTYFALWCRAFDESLLTIDNPIPLAAESGFGGERALSTWNQRMRMLKEIGFIGSHEGNSGEFHYVLIFNPHVVVQRIREKIQGKRFMQLYERAIDIGATDFQPKDTVKNEGIAKLSKKIDVSKQVVR